MKCEECQTAIEDYIDEALAVRTAREVSEHLSSCAICSRCHEDLMREQAVYASYQRDVDVTPALWTNIETRITREPLIRSTTLFERLRERYAGAFGTPRFSPAFAAALVVLAIGVTAVVMNYVGSRGTDPQSAQNGGKETPSQPSANNNGTTPETPKVSNPGSDEREKATVASLPVRNEVVPKRLLPSGRPTPEQLVREAEQKYVQAIAILSRDVNQRRSKVDPAVLARFDAALSDIDRTIAETKQASRQNPGDPIALQYMLAAYSKKVDALRDMARDEDREGN
jgi:Putative zinc-finger